MPISGIKGESKKEMLTALVVNTHSRRGRNLFFKSIDLLKKYNINVSSLHPVDNPNNLKEIIKDLIDKDYKLIIIGGGDGTISAIVDFFVHKDVTMGILPLGTSNSFARSLKIPLNIEDAVKVISLRKTIKADLGCINGKYFANTATIGFSARVAYSIDNNLKKYFGRLGYILQGIILFLSHKPFNVSVTENEVKYSFKTLELIIANGPFHGGMKIVPNANIRSHKLQILMMKGKSKWSLLKVWIAILFGRHLGLKEVTEINTNEAIIETEPEQFIDIDGEISGKTPIKLKSEDHALQIYSPINI